jgi:hypothetical protein
VDFIFMLTRNDQTVEDCLDVMAEIAPLGLRHIGFKDVGVPAAVLRRLVDAIKAAGATSYMEVVSTSREATLNSARVAAEIGIDRLLGGTDVETILSIVRGAGIAYFPFPGFPEGHPTRLKGAPRDVEAQCRRFIDQGCAGADLLAYRATDSDPLALVRAARAGLGKGVLVVAGSINSAERIRATAEAGADAFTIGSAAFDGSYAPRMGSLRSQLTQIMRDAGASERM